MWAWRTACVRRGLKLWRGYGLLVDERGRQRNDQREHGRQREHAARAPGLHERAAEVGARHAAER